MWIGMTVGRSDLGSCHKFTVNIGLLEVGITDGVSEVI